MGVSSCPRVINIRLISSCTSALAFGYAAANKAQADVRLVNQSPVASRLSKGRKCCSHACASRREEIFEIDSAALSRTRVSSTAARFSSGPRMTQAHSFPPTYSENPPSSSARTRRTSSSSSS